mgnify:CR=1 FL=1
MKKQFLGLAILQLTIVWLSVQALSAQDRREVLSEVTQLRQAGDFATAEEKLRDFVETHPQDSAIALSLGDLLAGSGKVDAALTAWTSMLPRVPPRPDHYVNVARRIRQVGRSKLALETLRGGVLAIGDKRPFLWDLAELHMELGHQQDAVTLHLELMRHEPYRLSQITGLLDILALQDAHGDPPVDNRWSQYVETLRASLDPKSREPGPALLLAHALLVSGHPAEGFAILADLTKSRWGDQIELATDGMMRFAQRSEQLGYAQIVIQTYGLLTQMTGDDRYASTSLQRRAQMHIRRGEPAAGIAIYRQLLTTIERPSARQWVCLPSIRCCCTSARSLHRIPTSHGSFFAGLRRLGAAPTLRFGRRRFLCDPIQSGWRNGRMSRSNDSETWRCSGGIPSVPTRRQTTSIRCTTVTL